MTLALRATTVAPGCARPYAEAEWREALVFVAGGEVELESLAGCRCRILPGDLVWLDGLPLRALHNRGLATALLIAISPDR
jgi:hypothetical protein